MRILILGQAITTLVDRYFASYENENDKYITESEKYDEYLYSSCLQEKIRLSNMFLEVIKPEVETSKKNQI